MSTNKEFLEWIHARLVNVHNENELTDYMHKLKEVAAYVDELERWKDEVYQWKEEGERIFGNTGAVGVGVAFSAGAWWADRPWRNRD